MADSRVVWTCLGKERMAAVLGDYREATEGRKASCGHTALEFLIKQHTRPPAPFAETEQDLMESLDFFL